MLAPHSHMTDACTTFTPHVQVRTTLTEDEAREWAADASAHAHGSSSSVFVVLFSDGSITADWSFDVIKKASILLSHGAEFVCTAEDAFNPTSDGFPLPGER